MTYHQKSLRLLALVALAAATLAVLSTFALGPERVSHLFKSTEAQTRGIDVSLRIAAQRLDGGWVRFALRVQDASGEWSQPVTPRAHRVNPATTRVGRWLTSSTLILEVDPSGQRRLLRPSDFDPAAAAQSGHTELRIRVQLLENDRIEFAAQQRTEDGWSDNILPSGRMMAAFGPATNWLSSTPISVSVDLPPAGAVERPTLEQEPTDPPINPVLRSGWRTAWLEYDAQVNESGRVNSVVIAHSEQGLQLQVGCFGDIRGVQLAGVPAGATGALTVTVDDAPSAVRWHQVFSEGEGSVLSAMNPERLFQELRAAATAEVVVEAPDPASASFALVSLWETPIQANIDQCGNYTDPAWQPIVDAQEGRTGDGVHYMISYPDGLDGRRYTRVGVVEAGAELLQQRDPIELSLICQPGRDLHMHMSEVPTDPGEHIVRSRVDGGAWVEERWTIWTNNVGRTYTNVQVDYDRLREAQSVEFEFPSMPVVRASFGLAALFDTPVQTNIDNCGVPMWPESASYVPIVNAGGVVSATVWYQAYAAADTVSTYVDNTIETPAPADDSMETELLGAAGSHLTLRVACWDGHGLQVSVQGIPELAARETDVTLIIDEREPETSTWSTWPLGGVPGAASSSPEPGRHLAQLRGASSLTVEIPATGLPPFTFDLRGMFNSPVQENIDECGFYKPGETREPPVELNTSGNTQGINGDATTVFWSRSQGPGHIPQTSLYEYRWVENQLEIGLVVLCGSTGPLVYLRGSLIDALSGDSVTVESRLDGAAAQRETWRLVSVSGRGFLSPPDAVQSITSWRDGSVLELKVEGANAIEQRFDLGTMFASPVVDSLDQCVAADLPAQAPSVTDVPPTSEGSLIYQASAQYGSEWVFTSVFLRSEGGGVALSCGIDGLGVQVVGIGSAGSAFISGDTVEVTWRVGSGAPRTDVWDTWLLGQSYRISPTDDAAFFAAINGADSLSISVASDPVFSETYDLAGNGFWSTPVQPNLDACGGS